MFYYLSFKGRSRTGLDRILGRLRTAPAPGSSPYPFEEEAPLGQVPRRSLNRLSSRNHHVSVAEVGSSTLAGALRPERQADEAVGGSGAAAVPRLGFKLTSVSRPGACSSQAGCGGGPSAVRAVGRLCCVTAGRRTRQHVRREQLSMASHYVRRRATAPDRI